MIPTPTGFLRIEQSDSNANDGAGREAGPCEYMAETRMLGVFDCRLGIAAVASSPMASVKRHCGHELLRRRRQDGGIGGAHSLQIRRIFRRHQSQPYAEPWNAIIAQKRMG